MNERKPLRVEFRYGGSIRHYKYFDFIEEATKATDTMLRYELGAFQPSTYFPSSKQIQRRGPRGGWSKVQIAVGQ